MRPNFLVIGAGKCGTTSLCALLDRHPQVFVCTPKEPNFLAFDEVYERGWAWYESLFEAGARAVARGEGSVAYSDVDYEQRVIDRIAEHLPDVRFLYIVRHPLERISSAFRELHSSGHKRGVNIPFSLREAMDRRPQLITNSMFWERISEYRARFPAERIHVLFLEDLRRNPGPTLRRCFEFLGVDPSVGRIDTRAHLNPGEVKLRDTRLMRLARERPWLLAVARRLPVAFRTRTRGLLRRPSGQSVTWDSDSREFALARIRDDARALLAHCGKPSDFWNLE